MEKLFLFRMTIIGFFFWCVIFPFFWAYHLTHELEASYLLMVTAYLPKFLFAAYCLLVLPCIWAHKKWAIYALWIGVISVPFMQYFLSELTYGPWLITLFLLAFLSWLFFLLNKMRI